MSNVISNVMVDNIDNTSAEYIVFFFSSRRRHTRFDCDWSSDVCSSDLLRHRVLLLQQNYCALLSLQHIRRASGYLDRARHASPPVGLTQLRPVTYRAICDLTRLNRSTYSRSSDQAARLLAGADCQVHPQLLPRSN